VKRGRSVPGAKTKRATATPPAPQLARLLDEAAAAEARGDIEVAIRGYRDGLAIAPLDIEALTRLGATLASVGRAREAAEVLAKARIAGPTLVSAQTRIGASYARIGRWGDAATAFEAAARLSSNEGATWTNLGVALIEVGRVEDARAALERAVLVEPLFVEGWLNLGRAVFDDANLGPAIDAFTRGVVSKGDHWSARFSLAVALELAGDARAAAQQLANLHAEKAWHTTAIDSFRYVMEHRTPKTRFFMSTRSTLVHATGVATLDGLSVELGVRHGVSARWYAEKEPERVLHGFDTFLGLPEKWHTIAEGTYSTHGEVPEVPSNIVLYPGLFADTLPVFVREHPGMARYVHVDCDLESSTREALTLLADRIGPGTVILFDEYLMREHWREDEFRAFQTVAGDRGWKYEYIAFSLFTGQAAVRILG
jgi:Flp pilus assembly protein TadD